LTITHIHTHTPIDTPIHQPTPPHTHTQTHLHTHKHTYTHTQTHTHAYTDTHTHTAHPHTHSRTHACKRCIVYTYMYTYIYIYTEHGFFVDTHAEKGVPAQEWRNHMFNTRVVKWKYYVSQAKIGSIIRTSGTIFNSLLYFNAEIGFNGLIYLYSVIDKRLPGNNKKWAIAMFVDDQSTISRILGGIFLYIHVHICHVPNESSNEVHNIQNLVSM